MNEWERFVRDYLGGNQGSGRPNNFRQHFYATFTDEEPPRMPTFRAIKVISADGSEIYMVVDEEEFSTLQTRSRMTGQRAQEVFKAEQERRRPRFSPDDRFFVFEPDEPATHYQPYSGRPDGHFSMRDRERQADRERRAEEAAYRRDQEERKRQQEQARRKMQEDYEKIQENLRQFAQATANLKSTKEQLADLAGVEWETARDMPDKVLYRKAQRKCHPDTGGSHDLWVKLDKLRVALNIG